jgi:hypothetical protein
LNIYSRIDGKILKILKLNKMTLEEQYIEEALKYKREKDNCKWWQFKKRAELETKRETCIKLAMIYAKNYPGR